jgi:LmbE family N-acetylglucosaminyl deacetylase
MEKWEKLEIVVGQSGMLKFRFLEKPSKLRVLCLGSHPDDIEIGCGGTVLRLVERGDVQFYWSVLSGNAKRGKEAWEGANAFLEKVKLKEIDIQQFRESYFPFVGGHIKDYFEKLKEKFSPDLVLTHYRNDAHQDHRLVSDLTWNTFRDHFILEYEVPKYDGDLGTPNFYVHLNESLVQMKISLISSIFKTQKEKHWFTEETFGSILRIRGVESNSPSKYAEAFHCRKIVF